MDIEKDLIPRNANLVRNKRNKPEEKKETVTLPVSSRPIAYEYTGTINPFENEAHFIRYSLNKIIFLSVRMILLLNKNSLNFSKEPIILTGRI